MPTMRDRVHFTLRAREYLEAALYCLAGALLFFRGPLLLRREYHIPYDLEGYHLPLLSFIGGCLRQYGQLPWWNPYTYMGEPFSATCRRPCSIRPRCRRCWPPMPSWAG